MIIADILSWVVQIARSKTREFFEVTRLEWDRSAQKVALDKSFAAIGALARDFKDGSSRFLALRDQVERTATALARIKGQIRADQAKRKALRLELKQIRSGRSAAAPRVADLQRQLHTLQNPDGGRRRRMLEAELHSLLVQLGRQALAEKCHAGILGTHYHTAQNIQDRLEQLAEAAPQLKDAERRQRQAMWTHIKGKSGELKARFNRFLYKQ